MTRKSKRDIKIGVIREWSIFFSETLKLKWTRMYEKYNFKDSSSQQIYEKYFLVFVENKFTKQ